SSQGRGPLGVFLISASALNRCLLDCGVIRSFVATARAAVVSWQLSADNFLRASRFALVIGCASRVLTRCATASPRAAWRQYNFSRPGAENQFGGIEPTTSRQT